MNIRRRRARDFALQLYVLHVALVTAVVGFVLGATVLRQVREVRAENARTIMAVADTAVSLPALRAAVADGQTPKQAQQIVQFLKESSGVDYVTVVGMDGIRIAHTNPSLVGQPVSSDHADVRAGRKFVGVETGPTGKTFRVKIPVRDPQGEIKATLSLGIAEHRLTQDMWERVMGVVLVGVPALLLGTLISWWLTQWVIRRFYHVEPGQMGALLLARATLLDGVSDGFVAVDPQGVVTLANPAASSLVGAEIHPGMEVREALPLELAAIANLPPSGDDRTFHEVHLGERTIVVTSTASHVKGEHLGTTLLLQDRSELEAALQALDERSAQLASLRRDAHEFDNRLHVLGGLLTMGRHREAVELLEREGTGMTSPEALHLGGVRDPQVAALLHSRILSARLNGVSIAVAEDSEVPAGAVDVDVLILVLGNLLANAVEAGATVITVYVQSGEGDCAILVDDNGPGVPLELEEDIFSEGWTTKGDRTGGRGVGLALVKSRVEARGGTVRVGESPLGGASFEVLWYQSRPEGSGEE